MKWALIAVVVVIAGYVVYTYNIGNLFTKPAVFVN